MTRDQLISDLERIAEEAGPGNSQALALSCLEEIRVLTGENDGLRTAIREHRDQRGDDRCWEDDLRLYAALGEGDVGPEAMALPPKCDFLKSCERYYDQRQVPIAVGTAELPGRMTIAPAPPNPSPEDAIKAACHRLYEAKFRHPGPISSIGVGVIDNDVHHLPCIRVFWSDRDAMRRLAHTFTEWEGFPVLHQFSGPMMLTGS